MSFATLREKVTFFEALDALNEIASDDEKLDNKEQEHRAKSKAFFSSKAKPKSKPKPRIPTIPQTQPAATTSTPLSKISRVDIIKATPGTHNLRKTALKNKRDSAGVSDTSLVVSETPPPSTSSTRPVPPSLQRSATLPPPSTARLVSSPPIQQSPPGTSATRKRKRQAETTAVAEEDQIFRELSFYYIPDDNVAPARRLRIARAQAYGAKWVRSVDEATHVIVDKRLVYRDIQNVIEANLMTSVPVLVNEDYPMDCLQFGTILDPDQPRYHISGRPPPASSTINVQTTSTHALSQVSSRSLQVKTSKAKRRKLVPNSQDRSQSQSEESTPQEQSFDAQEKQDKHAIDDQIAGNLDKDDDIPEPRMPVVPSLLSENHQSTSILPKISRRHTNGSPKVDPKDELSGCIELLQKYKDLPLDDPLEDDSQSVISNQEETITESEKEDGSADEHTHKRRSQRLRRPTQKQIEFEDRFACNNGGTNGKATEAQNPNARTIEVLQSMCDYYSRISDHWRTTAYRKAIATLKRQSTKITTAEEAYHLPNVGKRLAEKIEEIVTTDSLRRLEYAQDSPLDRVLATFLRIYDVGTGRANKWLSQGFRTLDDLKEKADLTPNQRIGIDHYDDLNTRIPREEVTALGDYIKRIAAQIDPAVELLIGGSYRRGAESSRDVDFIVTKKNTTSAADLVPFFERLLKVLTEKGCVVATLSALHANRRGKDGQGSKWLGCCVLPQEQEPAIDKVTTRSAKTVSSNTPQPVWRRVDFLLVPETEYGAALIYFTGNDIFNRSMRLLASKKGMRLNQRGLYKDVIRGRDRSKVTEGELVEGRDERRIFEILGVKWREPEERWC